MVGTAALAAPVASMCRPISQAPRRWEGWQALKSISLSDDGRMIDHSQRDLRTTSEGQSYAMFLALVDNDIDLFDRILEWTQNNLAGGDMASRLPAWLWGQHSNAEKWDVLDPNPASDADLWLAYNLLEAARLWKRADLGRIGEGLLAQVRMREVVELPGLGTMLLPGPQGFDERGYWRLNPSYLPLPVLRRFAALDAGGPWQALAGNTVRMLVESAPHGFVPNWIAWQPSYFFTDPVRGPIGSYDAIRVYLWLGMTDPQDPGARQSLSALHGPLDLLSRRDMVAETVNCRTGEAEGKGPYGFHAALLPYLKAQDEIGLAAKLRGGLPTPAQQRATEPAYYSHMLSLFGAGWYDGRFRFAPDGRLLPAWNGARP